MEVSEGIKIVRLRRPTGFPPKMVFVLSPPSPPPTRIAKCTPDSIPITGEKPLLRRFLRNLPSSQTAFPLVNRHHQRLLPLVAPKASVGSAEYIVEPETKVEFPKELKVPACSESLILLGTGFREKVFAIIGVKIYAAGFYAEASIREKLGPWRGKPADEIVENSAIFRSIFQEPLKKTLKIMLVRNVDGKTFWDALNDAISSRIKVPTTADEVALSTFGNTFQTRDLKNGTLILLTWVEPSKMLVSISSDGLPGDIDAAIESENVTMALFDGYFGDSPVSPTLKASVADGITVLFN